MNNDLISRSALKKKIEEVQYTQEFCIEHKIDYSVSMQMLGMVIDNAPTVCNDNYSMGYQDGVKKVLSDRPQGEWINEHCVDIGYKTAECSCCGERSRLISHDTGFGYEYEYYPFCHWCGADMRGGKSG